MQKKSSHKKNNSFSDRSNKVLPAVFILLSVLLMLLPLESPVMSAKVLLSYIFVPQIRAAHGAVEYAEGVNKTIRALLDTHGENERLKEEMAQLRLENAQAREVFLENERLSAALHLQTPRIWGGIWAKTAYREPTQWNSVIIDKGTLEGVQERAAVIAQKDGEPVLAGVVLEAQEHTAKVLLLRDEDFSAAVYASPSGEEGLLVGAGAADMKMQYLPFLSDITEGEKVYTSSASGLFPAGILVGEVTQVGDEEGMHSSLTARVEPAADASAIRELFVLTKPTEKQK